MNSKWFGYSKIVLGSVLIVLNSVVGIPFLPPEWAMPLNAVLGVLIAIDRALGPKAALSLTP